MKFHLVKDKRVLISPLNWGMGHVSRCIGLIHRLKKNNNTVIVACDKNQEEVLELYFPCITFIHHEGYPFQFSGKRHFGLDLIKNLNRLNMRHKSEFLETEELVKLHQIDVVISDHRYGFRSESVPSIFVTHQLRLPLKWIEVGAQFIHKYLINKFDYFH